MTYRTIAPDELKSILSKHKEWLADSTTGERANLRCANLSYADLRSANLRSADLSCANLSYADLRSADLRCANLSYADLRSADLRCADLRSADLSCANLSYANLSCANLRSANLSYADLRSADLSYADLRYADLLIFQYQRHTAYFTFDGSLRIGCHVMPITEWTLGYEEIGKAEGYSAEQIFAYGSFIKICVELFEKRVSK